MKRRERRAEKQGEREQINNNDRSRHAPLANLPVHQQNAALC